MKSTVPFGVIPEFTGEFAFLSNFYEWPFTWRGIEFKSGEHAFQYAKTFFMDNPTARMRAQQEFTLQNITPSKAKYIGRSVNIDLDGWDASKVQYMREVVHAKFKAQGMGGRLLNTGARLLVEGNDWGDKMWGRCKNEHGVWVGLNTLGTILMEERGYWLYSNFKENNE